MFLAKRQACVFIKLPISTTKTLRWLKYYKRWRINGLGVSQLQCCSSSEAGRPTRERTHEAKGTRGGFIGSFGKPPTCHYLWHYPWHWLNHPCYWGDKRSQNENWCTQLFDILESVCRSTLWPEKGASIGMLV